MQVHHNAVKCCILPILASMVRKAKPARRISARSTRVSVSLSIAHHHMLGQIAEQKKVSVAWVVRDAIDKYVSDQWPLLEQRQE